MNLKDFFDCIYVINLKRRGDRLAEFWERLGQADWPFVQPTVFEAIEGDITGTPSWWSQGGGAWGCLMSHCRIMEICMQGRVRNVLFLEDDVTFCEDFAAKAEVFLKAIPENWDHLYFGGQHLKHPVDEGESLFRCNNVNRTHAHAMTRRYMKRVYRHVLNAPDYMKWRGSHIDHRLGALHETGTVKVYAPKQFLCAQAEGKSDISGRKTPEYYWNTWRDVPDAVIYVILDVHCGAGQKVAELMKHTGFHYGHNLQGHTYQVEDAGIARICESTYIFPKTTRARAPDDTAGPIHDFIGCILCEAANYGQQGAMIYPHLCAMYKDVKRAWKHIRVINVESNFDLAVRALTKRATNPHDRWLTARSDEVEALQKFLYMQKKEWLAKCDHLTIRQEELSNETEVMKRIRDFTDFNRKQGSVSVAG